MSNKGKIFQKYVFLHNILTTNEISIYEFTQRKFMNNKKLEFNDFSSVDNPYSKIVIKEHEVKHSNNNSIDKQNLEKGIAQLLTSFCIVYHFENTKIDVVLIVSKLSEKWKNKIKLSGNNGVLGELWNGIEDKTIDYLNNKVDEATWKINQKAKPDFKVLIGKVKNEFISKIEIIEFLPRHSLKNEESSWKERVKSLSPHGVNKKTFLVFLEGLIAFLGDRNETEIPLGKKWITKACEFNELFINVSKDVKARLIDIMDIHNVRYNSDLYNEILEEIENISDKYSTSEFLLHIEEKNIFEAIVNRNTFEERILKSIDPTEIALALYYDIYWGIKNTEGSDNE